MVLATSIPDVNMHKAFLFNQQLCLLVHIKRQPCTSENIESISLFTIIIHLTHTLAASMLVLYYDHSQS